MEKKIDDKKENMRENIRETNFNESLKKPADFKSKHPTDYKKYLDEFYSQEWIMQYFKREK